MAKLFYTLDEVAQKLNKTPDEVREMARRGAIQEFRDRDKLMFKVDQIDLLVGGEEESGEIPLLEDSRLGGSGLDLQDSGLALADSREGSGMSAFDSGDHGERASARTQPAGATGIDDELSLDAVGSGSGLLDLTRESDDTSLGAELLEEVYQSDDNVEIPANASGLFDAAGVESPGNALGGGVAMAPILVESYDGAWSGLGLGLLLGAVVALVAMSVVLFVGLQGSTAGLTTMFAGNLMIWAGGLLGATLLFGVAGFFIGKATE
ncbi:MAG TPA: helix-turn-helix domain-containing protein [Phycisphaerales bacterium]|nr:helix-turn-helix domain-containing protein [Phycisphaerales bacterium]HMP35972.1 helix-turn-helix domain-containing protein [Phycisphaerales bacterium]